MGHGVDFPGTNRKLGPPKGMDETSVYTLPVYSNGACCVSKWALSPEELEEVQRTGCVYVSVFSGKSMPPIFVGGEEQVRQLIADYGVWKK